MDAPRPLGPEGRRVWGEFVGRVRDVELLLRLCEVSDERAVVRGRVLRDGGSASDLRVLDRLVSELWDDVVRDVDWLMFEEARRR